MRLLGNLASIGSSTGTLLHGLASLGGLRLPVTAFSVAALQALLIDDLGGPVFRHLDVPLAVVIALALTRPANAVVTGFIFGLAVDAFQMKLFGLHGLAYSVLGPVAALVPLGSLRGRAEIVASMATVQCLVATTIVLGGAWLTDRHIPSNVIAGTFQVTLWSVAIALPLTAALGGRMGLQTPDRPDHVNAATSADWR